MEWRNKTRVSALTRRSVLIGGGVALLGAGTAFYRYERPNPHHKLHADGRYRRITLAWPNPDFDPVLVIARKKGIFSSYNLDVTVLDSITSGNQAISALVDGHAVAAAAPVLRWIPRLRDENLPTHLLCGVRPGSFRLLTRKSGGITRVESLAGKTIGIVQEDAADRLFFSVLMRRKGIDAVNGITWRTIPVENAAAALLHGDVDALAAHDPLAWEILHDPSHDVVELINSVSGHYGERVSLVIGATNEFLQTDPDAAATLALAIRDAAKWTRENLDEVATIISDDTDALTYDSILDMLRHEGMPSSPIAKELRVQVAQYIDELKLLGMIPDELDSAGYARKICASLKPA